MSDKYKDVGAAGLPPDIGASGIPGGKPFYTIGGRNISVDGVEVGPHGQPLVKQSDSFTRQLELDAAKSKLAALRQEPPAPVAVVLPERFVHEHSGCFLTERQHGWNACLDKVKEMNQ